MTLFIGGSVLNGSFPRLETTSWRGKQIQTVLSTILSSYLPVYLWKQMVRRTGGDLFVEFLALLANKQLCRDTDTEVSCVINFSSVCVISVHRMLRVLLLLLPSSRHNFPTPHCTSPASYFREPSKLAVNNGIYDATKLSYF